MSRLRVHYACDRCGHKSSGVYFAYGYHETEVVQAPCDGCGYMTQHTPQNAVWITEEGRAPERPTNREARRPRLQSWRQFQQHGFTRWECSGCGAIEQSLDLPGRCDCAD